jgi:2-polyprenyl-6-methoxyphenol hydroxylase-like FAD-dependent oxidoreductase
VPVAEEGNGPSARQRGDEVSNRIARQAIVIGAGIGGLVAARAVADGFEHVLVLERDHLPRDASHRSGTPQSRHAHALLCGGARALDELFPGFTHHLARAGAVMIDFPLDTRIERPGFDPFPQRKLALGTCCASRPLIEFTVRQFVEQLGNVTIRQGCRVQGIETTPGGAIVTGLRCVTAEKRTDTLSADLVVDASGRGGLILQLLKSIGHPLPEDTSIGMDIGYATALFAIPDDAPEDWKATAVLPDAPETSRGGFLFPCEGNQWIVTLAGMHDDKPPGDWQGFHDFARSLRTRTIYDAIAQAERIGEIHRFALPASTLRHFERLDAFPRGLLPLGDAICRFNPVYGQGMTVASIEALHLRRLLLLMAGQSDPLAGLATNYFAEVRQVIQAPWSVANLDLVYPKTSGTRPPEFADMIKFGAGVIRLAARDPAVHLLFSEVQQLLRPNAALREPAFVERVKAVMVEA